MMKKDRSKFSYYLSNALSAMVPRSVFKKLTNRTLLALTEKETAEYQRRVNYYNKVNQDFSVSKKEKRYSNVGGFKKTTSWAYYFDLRLVIRGFYKKNEFNYINGDVVHIPNVPSFVKSRPIQENNQNSVILKLNKIRHYKFFNDKTRYQDKKNMLVWRGATHQTHRKEFIQTFYAHPQCNIGATKPILGEPWETGFMSVEEQMQYKFIFSIEGNDVATNLKWAMASNSLVIMARPKYETWFMEGQLEAGVHYVEVRDDYSDLIEKMNYFIAHENEALDIIHNAHQWVAQFQNEKVEHLLSLMVADKYFRLSGQYERCR